MVRYGFHHVLEGVDHLLFLIAVLLPAPLIAAAGRWRRGTGPVSTAKAVLRVVTAFTLGHSITLIAAAVGWITVPSRPVEVLIAASVGVAAVHAVRPLAARGEAILATGFGLVHGLAFAGVLSDLGIDGTTSLLSLLAFNVGIELAQLTGTCDASIRGRNRRSEWLVRSTTAGRLAAECIRLCTSRSRFSA
jgi:HupE / UreJ protein